jgi:hypothetical protein
METRSSQPCSEQSATGLYSEPQTVAWLGRITSYNVEFPQSGASKTEALQALWRRHFPLPAALQYLTHHN